MEFCNSFKAISLSNRPDSDRWYANPLSMFLEVVFALALKRTSALSTRTSTDVWGLGRIDEMVIINAARNVSCFSLS